ncbi:hypothetical protein [Cohnella yongneupensis]|uniref:Lipoprotein n=1 Tax=Cohnella yongneupensis TaxID=425006 RepID=A0ABW0R572_9BACL
MKKSWLIVIMGVIVLLAGCGGNDFKPNAFSKADACIVKSDSHSKKVCYGDTRTKAEKVLGDGEEFVGEYYEYENGVVIGYRKNKVVAISLREESEGEYSTARGAEAGMEEKAIKRLYGAKSVNGNTEYGLTYYIDMDKWEPIVTERPSKADQDILIISTQTNDDEETDNIWIGDLAFAIMQM